MICILRYTKSIEKRARNAVTLVEVIFSIGVILIGLLGLLSILPLAGRRAQDTLSLNIGSAISDSILAQLESRNSLSHDELLALDGTAVSGAATPSFLIDPLFASTFEEAANDNLTDGITVPPTATLNGYSESFFPYFKANHNPLLDPSGVNSTGSGAWPLDQPRQLRVGYIRGTPTPTVPAGHTSFFLDSEQARTLVENGDDLPVIRPVDASRPSTFSALQGNSGSQLEYGKRIPSGDFTWMATVNPLPGGIYASVSVVVMRQRERNFVAPANSTGASDVNENSVSERLAYVTYASGFSGGAGGVVHLVASAVTSPSIGANDWVMLSRTDSGNTFHRWYRVVAVDQEPEFFETTGTPSTADTNLGAFLPAGSTGVTVWRHKVLLDGPDWAFGFTTPGYADEVLAVPTTANPDNTIATIVQDVVSVSERVVLLSDL